LIATIMVGRRGQRSPIGCFEAVADEQGLSIRWTYLGWLLVLSAYLLLTFFSVVASWTFAYLVHGLSTGFQGLGAEESVAVFDQVKSDPLRVAGWHALFMGITLYVVGGGIRRGIERAIKLMMPILFLLLLVLLVYALTVGEVAESVAFLFMPDLGKLDGNVALLAVGQAMLSLSVGGAGMLVYGAYLGKKASIPRAALTIAGADTGVALVMGLIIFPVVFAYGLEPGAGPGLIFVTLPIAFGQMPAGGLFGLLFFVLLLLAALTSAFSMFEPVVAWLSERHRLSRRWAALLTGIVAWFIGLATVFSFSIWSHVRPLAFLERFSDMSIFRVLEYFVTALCMPLGTLLVTVFVGWVASERMRIEEFGADGGAYGLWRLSTRYLAPIAVFAIFAVNL